MINRLYMLLGGPVLRREFRRMAVGRGPQILTFVYAAGLLIQSYFTAASIAVDRARVRETFEVSIGIRRFGWGSPLPGMVLDPEHRWTLNYLEHKCVLDKAAEYVSLLLYQQLALLLLVVPVLAAGAVVYEKEKDTLQALFGTELTGGEIVAGKVLGRLAGIARVALAVLPPLAFAAALADVPLPRVFLALAQAAVLTFALASGCLLLSLWTRRVSDAVIGSYSALIVGFVLLQFVLSKVSLPVDYLDPLDVLSRILTPGRELRVVPVLTHFAAWGAFGLACCALTAARLRPVSLGLMDARPPRWAWALRPRIGNNPVQWREAHCLGLAPLPILRLIPRWMGRLGVLAFAGAIAGDSLKTAVGWYFFDRLLHLDISAAWAVLARPRVTYLMFDINLMGGLLIVLGGLTMAVRCAGSILEEKRRKTWEDLILTPLSMSEILRGKYRGIVQAAVIPLALYALPMLGLSSLGGWDAVALAAAWLAAACVLLPLAGSLGMEVARGENTGEAPRLDSRTPRPFHLGGNVLD